MVDELIEFRVDSSDEQLTSLNAAIERWHAAVGAWNEATSSEATQKL